MWLRDELFDLIEGVVKQPAPTGSKRPTKRFFQVVYDLGLADLTGPRSAKFLADIKTTSSLLSVYARPIYGLLNGIYLRKNKFHFGDYRGLVIDLSDPAKFPTGHIENHGIRGEFPGQFLYTTAALGLDEMGALAPDVQIIGERIIKIYDDGLAKVRGRFGIPADFLVDFFDEFRARGYSSAFEGKKVSFPKYGLATTMTFEATPLETRHYLAVRRMRSKKETRVLVGVIDKAGLVGMFHTPTFDGTSFHLRQWLAAPYWPVSFVRNSVPLAEFDI
ncbi:MAG: hypothetical protein ABI459_06705 [Deltaproteobacteria bacterium]